MSESRWMIYGANGFTGELIAREAKKRGLAPILAGRNKQAIPALARELGLEYRVFSLESSAIVVEHLLPVDLVLHCAGPFSQTSEPMVSACLASRTDYLDITGEVEVFEAVHRQHQKASQRGVVLLPGVGFDVVPTDCLALNLKKLLPDANRLVLAFHSQGRPSHGTAKTVVEGLKLGGRIRENGVIKPVPYAYKVRELNFNEKPRLAATIPWGDVSTAFYTTGIPNIEVYMTFQKSQIVAMKLMRPFKPLLGSRFIQNQLKARAASGERGPDAAQRAETHSYIWGQVSNDAGQTREAFLITPNGYEVTVHAALGIVDYMLSYPVEHGARTPAKVMGEHFIRTLPGVEMRILQVA